MRLFLRRQCIVPTTSIYRDSIPRRWILLLAGARARAHESERGFSLRGKVRQEIHGEERERAAVAGGTERGRKRAGRWVEGGEREKPLTHNTIRRLRLLRWILKDPRDYYFFLFFHFHSSIIISEE